MTDNSYQKYLKYKNKYLRLKAEMESKGGMLPLVWLVAGGVAAITSAIAADEVAGKKILSTGVKASAAAAKEYVYEKDKKEEIRNGIKNEVTTIMQGIKDNFNIDFKKTLSDKDKYSDNLIDKLMNEDSNDYEKMIDETVFTLLPGSDEKIVDEDTEVKLTLGFFRRVIINLKDRKLDASELKQIYAYSKTIKDMAGNMEPGDNNEQIKEQNKKMKLAINRLFNHLQTYINKPRGGILFPTNFYQY